MVADRPRASPRPRWPDLVYPVNHSQVPGTLGGDSQPVDAYLLGGDVPLSEAEGVVTTTVLRAGDREDKRVIGRPGALWTDAGIMKALSFQGRYFQLRLVR